MKAAKKATVFMLLIVLLSALFFACTKKAQLTALATGPTISNIASSASSTSATITWTTNTMSTSKVYYSLNTVFSNSTTETDTGVNITRNHTVTITGLSPNTRYYFCVASTDSAGNTSKVGEDWSYTVTTTGVGPTITNVTATSTSTTATITWTTNEGATSQVFYGTTASFGSNTPETTTTTVTSHTVSLPDLIANTKYYYYVKSKNAAGNTSTSGDDGSKFFTTSEDIPIDAFSIYFDDIKIEGTGGTPIIIYDDDLGNVITGGTNNAAYMGSPNNGIDNITAIDFLATDEKHSGTCSWKITLKKTASWWAGIYILSTGEWRANWTASTPAPANLTGPTGTVKLTCYAKVVGKTATQIKIGIGDNSGATVDDSLTGGKVEGSKTSINSTDWTLLEVNLTYQDLSSINGVFFWAIDGANVP